MISVGAWPDPATSHLRHSLNKRVRMHQREEWLLFNKVCILCYESGWVLPIVLVSTLSGALDPGNREVKQSEELAAAKMQRNGPTLYIQQSHSR